MIVKAINHSNFIYIAQVVKRIKAVTIQTVKIQHNINEVFSSFYGDADEMYGQLSIFKVSSECALEAT